MIKLLNAKKINPINGKVKILMKKRNFMQKIRGGLQISKLFA
jgi:hypothetical protein